MAIQIEVTLQPDYTYCLRVMGNKLHWEGKVFDDYKSQMYYFVIRKMAPLDATGPYNTNASERMSVFCVICLVQW